MLSLGSRAIWLYRGWVDMRSQVDRLALLVEGRLGRDPYGGEAFVFLGRDRRRVKILVWDRSGYWLASKRPEQGLYAAPVVLEGRDSRGVLALSPADLALLLEGVSVHRATYAPHYRREAIPAQSGVTMDG